MRERVESIGGRLTLDTRPMGGTRMQIVWANAHRAGRAG
jgi:signal transduction histidine kinase